MRLYKSKTKRLYLTFQNEWIWMIHILPSILVTYIAKEDNIITMSENKGYTSYIGDRLNITFSWLIFDLEIDFWWNLTEKTYENTN